jgi:multiple sugar transport system substrate-binding protein
MATRREFLRLAAGAALAAGACASNGGDSKARAVSTSTAKKERTLRIVQWGHFVPAYDQWFDNEYTRQWGLENDVEVVVDHISILQLQDQAGAEVARQAGHDIFFFLTPPATLEDDVIDHREIVEEAKSRLGPMTPLLERGILNPKTKKYLGFPEFWAPYPVNYRSDAWGAAGLRPDSWDDIRRGAPILKAAGAPVGFSFARADPDANWALLSLMFAHGASIQDESGNVIINSKETIEALRVGTAIYREGMTPEVLTWDGTSNNRFLASGSGSMTLNPVSAIRAVEKQDPDLASRIALVPVPSGPAARLGTHSVFGTYAVWKFARNPEAAKQFLVDLAVNYREAFLRSELYNLPGFPGAVKDLDEILANDPAARPPGKYALLAKATDWSTNIGHPGATNAAVDEVFNQYVVTEMFAMAAKGEATPEEAARMAEAKITPIFDKWREQGKI